MAQTVLSVVAPVFNEKDNLEEFHRQLDGALSQLGVSAEILFINDGSTDDSLSVLRELKRKDSRVKILDFSRNFGHQVAVKAGIDHSAGDAVVIMDTDLQDPPQAIVPLFAKWKEGYEVVYVVRGKREGETFFKKATSALYYRLMRRISGMNMPLDAGDFRLISRPVADVIKNIHERRPYIRGLVSWVGFRQTGIVVDRPSRFKGETKYSLRKMLSLAWNGIVHFSFLPLQVATFVGFLASLLCLLWIGQALYVSIVLKTAVPGWTSMIIAVLFLGSAQLITLGIMGSYLARNFDESRSRPLYILNTKENS